MPVTPLARVAFRCKSCGRLHEAAHAGEDLLPHACRVCGAGVAFDPRTGVKTFLPDNWEVLAECPPPRLKELGLGAEHVEKHAPARPSGPVHRMFQSLPPAPGRQVRAGAREGASGQDRAG